MRDDPAIYLWFLHRELLDALLRADRVAPWRRAALAARLRAGDPNSYADELERWLRSHEVRPLDVALHDGSCRAGEFVWTELDFQWSDVAQERAAANAGGAVRSTFHGHLEQDGTVVCVHGTFDPVRLTCSTANVELRGVSRQYVLGYVTALDCADVELRPLAIATRLVAPPGRRWSDDDWQEVKPAMIDQFAAVRWDEPAGYGDLERLRHASERAVKAAFAAIIGEPVIPNDWGGEQFDLWTPRLIVQGEPVTAAWLLKGPARFAPMTVAMLGKNGDQIERLARTAAELLVVQHCHEIRSEVVSMLRSVASDFRQVRRYMLIDGFDTVRILGQHGFV